jgi:hypothetical protein
MKLERECYAREFEAETQDGEIVRVTEVHAFESSKRYSRKEPCFRVSNGHTARRIGGGFFQVIETKEVLYEKP